MKLILTCLVLTACGSADITQVDRAGHRIQGAEQGLYVPYTEPYLLVTYDTAPASPSPPDTMSFSADGVGYRVKLLYLTDESRYQAIKVNPGLFNSASLGAVLGNGALNSLNVAADNSKLLDAVAQVAAAAAGGKTAPAKAAVTTAANSTKKSLLAPGPALLEPGLYQLTRDTAGHVAGIKQLTSFKGGSVQ